MTKSVKTGLTITVIALAAILLLGWNAFFGGGGGPSDADKKLSGATHDVPCINPALPIPNDLHIHPHLKIIANGKTVEVPAQIGLGIVGCERALHTHDDSGTIHVEPNFYIPFTLGDFMSVWGKPFSKDRVLEYTTDATHELVMTVDGVENKEWADLVLKDKQQIVIEYRATNESRIQIGNVSIDRNAASSSQDGIIQGGHQPWRLDPKSVLRAEAKAYGFSDADIASVKLIARDNEGKIATFEITHGGTAFVITLIEPLGKNTVWVISDVEKRL